MYHLRGLLWGDIPGDRQKLLQFPKKSDCDEFNWLWDNNTHCFTDLYFFYQLGDGIAVSLQYYFGVGTQQCRVGPIISRATGTNFMSVFATCQLF
jgi:hypothetical protein